MYEYKFVRIELNFWGNNPKDDYQDIIIEHGKEGWRFVQIFAPPTKGYGAAAYFEVIFERPINQ